MRSVTPSLTRAIFAVLIACGFLAICLAGLAAALEGLEADEVRRPGDIVPQAVVIVVGPVSILIGGAGLTMRRRNR